MRVVSAVVRVLSWLVLTIVALTLLLIAPLVAGYHPVVVLSGSSDPALMREAIQLRLALGYSAAI